MNKAIGNMYAWANFTWNPVKGKCPHACAYCYMRRFPLKEPRLVESEFDELGKGNMIFVGSSIDLFAEAIPRDWIEKVLAHASLYHRNTYLFQSKNPERFNEFSGHYPPERIFGTTIETDAYPDSTISKAPIPIKRAYWMARLKERKMISIEPIMKFNLEKLVELIRSIQPEFVSIGADSKGHNLVEPSKEEVKALVTELEKHAKVIIKPNLNRILGE